MYENKYIYVLTVWIISSILDNRSRSLFTYKETGQKLGNSQT